MKRITRRRLTTRQVAVLAALERRGDATTVPELRRDFPQLNPAELVRVLDSLVCRGLVMWTGDRTWIYLGDIPKVNEAERISRGHKPIPPEDIVRFWTVPRSER